MAIIKNGPLPYLTDVDDDIAPNNGDALIYDGNEWVAKPIPEPSTLALAELTDVSDSLVPTPNQVLRYNGAEWNAATPALAPDDIITTAGDFIVGDGAANAVRLAKGAVGNRLRIKTGDATPTWDRDVYNVRDYGATGDGVTNDTVTIAAAVAAIPATGGVLFFPAGTYLLASGNINIFGKTDLTMQGVGRASLIKFGAAPGQTIMVQNIGSPLGNDDIAFEALAFDTAAIAGAIPLSISGNARRVRVSDCHFINPKNGVQIGSAQDVIIANNQFLGQGDGVQAITNSSPERLTIIGNTFDGQGAVGSGVNINSPTGNARRVTVVGNTVTNYITSGSNGFGIGFAHVVGGAISGNTVSNCGLDGIHIEDGCEGIVIQGNSVSGCGRSGIAVNSSNAARHTRQLSVVGNSVTGCLTVSGTGAIALEGSQAHHDCVVSGNIVRGNGRVGAECYGIDFSFGADGDRITDNTVTNTIGTTTAGIRLAASTNVNVQGNRCTDDQGTKTQVYGIKVQGNQTDTTVEDNDLAGNLTGVMDESGIGTRTRLNKGHHFNVLEYGAKGDGTTDDKAAIQAAMTAAAAVKGTVLFPDGTYAVKTASPYLPALTVSSPGVRLAGEGTASIVPTSDCAIGVQLLKVAADDVSVTGLSFDGLWLSGMTGLFLTTAARTTIRGNRFLRTRSGGVHVIAGVTDLHVTDNEFVGPGYGVLINEPGTGGRYAITNNVFRGEGLALSGTATGGSTTTLVDSTKTWTVNQWIDYTVQLRTGTGSVTSRTVVSNTATTLTVATWTAPTAGTTYVIGRDADAITINCPTAGISDVLISDNLISNYQAAQQATGLGIGLARVAKATVTGNRVEGCRIGIHVEDRSSDVTITGNTVSGCFGAGIEDMELSGKACEALTIVGNLVSGCCTAPPLTSPSTGFGAIELSAGQQVFAKGLVCSGNLCSGNGRAGIFGWSLTSANISDNICKNNGTVVGSAGIDLTTAIDTIISGNRCYDDQGTKTQTYGLKTFGSGQDTIITSNNFQGNLTSSISDGFSTAPWWGDNIGDFNGAMLHSVSAWVADNATNPTLGLIPANSWISNVKIHVREAFNSDGTDLLSVGIDANQIALCTATDVSTIGIKAPVMGTSIGYNSAARTIEAYYVAGGSAPTTGKALVIVEFYRVATEIA